MHLAGSIGQLQGNTARIAAQRGVATMVAVKTGLTVAALLATAYSRVLGRKVSANQNVPIESGTEPSPALTPDDVAGAQRQLAVLQWGVPVLTGALVVVSAYAGEQQRAGEASKGLLGRLTGGGVLTSGAGLAASVLAARNARRRSTTRGRTSLRADHHHRPRTKGASTR
jgi:hypothetical protein